MEKICEHMSMSEEVRLVRTELSVCVPKRCVSESVIGEISVSKQYELVR